MKRLIVALLFLPVLAFASITSQTDKTGPVALGSLPQTVSVGFPFQAQGDLVVLDSGGSGGVRDPAVVLTLGSDYTVTGGGYNGSNQMLVGSITVVRSGANNVISGDKITIMRGVAINQISVFNPSGPNTITLLEQALDKMATLSQQVNEIGGRSLQFENFETLSPLLNLAARQGTLLGFDANGNIAFVPTSTTPGRYVSNTGTPVANQMTFWNSATAIQGVAGLTTDGAGKITLGVPGSVVGAIAFNNTTSGTVTLQPPYGALGVYSVLLPNASCTLPVFTQPISFTGPTAARTITLPDANFTVARTDAANTFTAGVRQTFAPNATTPGLNVGSNAGDPSTPSNGDIWYDSTGNLLRARINGATASIGAGSSFANPTASVGLSVVNGSASTAMRSDAAPAIDQTISPTWTGQHTFGQSGTGITTKFYGPANAQTAIFTGSSTTGQSFGPQI